MFVRPTNFSRVLRVRQWRKIKYEQISIFPGLHALWLPPQDLCRDVLWRESEGMEDQEFAGVTTSWRGSACCMLHETGHRTVLSFYAQPTGGSRLPNWGQPSPHSLRSRPLKYSYGSGGVLEAPQWVPQRKSDLVHFSLKIWHLVAPVFTNFLSTLYIKVSIYGQTVCLDSGPWPDWPPPLDPPLAQPTAAKWSRRTDKTWRKNNYYA